MTGNRVEDARLEVAVEDLGSAVKLTQGKEMEGGEHRENEKELPVKPGYTTEKKYLEVAF
jgi:hypothetical protein